jgi:hypothetical protein
LNEIQGQDRIWLCGAYSLPGIPLLENAVRSGLAAAEAISGQRRPWYHQPAHAQSFAKQLLFALLILLIALFAFRLMYKL